MITTEKCKWCEGSGIDSDGVAIGNPYPCSDCEGTGFKHKQAGRTLFLEEWNREDETIGMDDNPVRRLMQEERG